MALHPNALMLDLQQKYAGLADKNERRASRYGAFELFKRDYANSSIISPTTKAAIEESFGSRQVIDIVLDAQDVTIGNVRQCVVTDDENNANTIVYTFATAAFGFTMTPAQHVHSEVDYQMDFNKKLEKYLLKLAAQFDTACISQLETDKNQFFANIAPDFYALGDGVTTDSQALQVPAAERTDMYNQIEAIMQTMDFYGMTDIVCTPAEMAAVRRYLAQGDANAINESFQFGPYTFHTTNRIVNGDASVASTLYAVEAGSTSFFTRLAPEAKGNYRSTDGHEWTVANNVPLVGIDMEYKYSSTCSTDRIAATGSDRLSSASLLESHEWAVDFGTVTVYNSNRATRYNPIQKFEVLA